MSWAEEEHHEAYNQFRDKNGGVRCSRLCARMAASDPSLLFFLLRDGISFPSLSISDELLWLTECSTREAVPGVGLKKPGSFTLVVSEPSVTMVDYASEERGSRWWETVEGRREAKPASYPRWGVHLWMKPSWVLVLKCTSLANTRWNRCHLSLLSPTQIAESRANCCCFKPLSFEVICYTAIDGWNIRWVWEKCVSTLCIICVSILTHTFFCEHTFFF